MHWGNIRFITHPFYEGSLKPRPTRLVFIGVLHAFVMCYVFSPTHLSLISTSHIVKWLYNHTTIYVPIHSWVSSEGWLISSHHLVASFYNALYYKVAPSYNALLFNRIILQCLTHLVASFYNAPLFSSRNVTTPYYIIASLYNASLISSHHVTTPHHLPISISWLKPNYLPTLDTDIGFMA